MPNIDHSYEPIIAKENLVDGAYYNGRCRNASIARWSAATQTFFYIRSKFGYEFVEAIKCPEDDKKYDVFVAESICENPPYEIDYDKS